MRDEVGSIPSLDGVRGIAVLWVIVFHYVWLAPPPDPWVAALSRAPWLDAIARHGYLGVDLFFVLSGFLLVLPWMARARRGAPPPDVREFYTRRVLRIVPAYYVHLVVLCVAFLPMLQGWMWWRPDAYVVLWNLIAHGAFLHLTSPLTSSMLGVNGALWSLAIEAQFYLLLPLLAPAAVRAPVLTALMGISLSVAWRWAAMHDLSPLVALYLRLGAHWGWPEGVVRAFLHTQLPAYLGHFALGALLAAAWLRRRAPEARTRGVAWYLLARGPLAFTGRVSYSAYLYHLPLLLVARKYATDASAAFAAGYLGLVMLAAWLSWRFVEQPWLRPARANASPP